MATSSRTYDTWLNPETASAVVTEEPLRFKALVQCLETDVRLASNDSNPDAWHSRVLRWVPLLNNFLDVKNVNLRLEDVQLLCHSLWTAVLASSHDLETQVRCASTLVTALRQRKRDLALQLPWRPLYQLLRNLVADPVPKMSGMGLSSHRHATLFQLASKARRFFGHEAAAEVWQEMAAGLREAGDAAARYDALGWLALLLPTHDICKCDWVWVQGMLDDWMQCWASVTCNRQWDSLWAGLVCKLAKHDWKGAIDWGPHLPRLFTHAMGLLEVPVGTSSGSSPITGSPTPRKSMRLFMPLLMHSESHLAACTIVHVLKSTPERPHTAAASAAALANLNHLVCLIEQYFHPSNTGKWSRELASLLKHHIKAFGRQMARQGAAPEPWQAALQPDTQRAFVDAVLKLAARAQFSKDDGLSRMACSSLGQLAYVAPDLVLPLVMARFRSALETSTATHQLAAAISSLAYCVRPMLLSGWPGPEAEESGPQMLAEAMMALLPGIDANDEAKTDAVLHLYTVVLACVPRLGNGGEEDAQQQGLSLPLYEEEWSDELLSRLLALLENLDTGPGAHRGTDQGTGAEGGGALGASAFLVKQGGLLGHLFELLLCKLAPEQARALVKRLAAWVVTTTLPSVESEVVTLIAEAATHHPQLMLDALVTPLAARIQSDLPLAAAPVAPSGHPPLSFSQEASLKCRLHLLCECLAQLPGRSLLPLLPSLTALAEQALGVPLYGVQVSGALLLGTLCQVMCRRFCYIYGPPDVPYAAPLHSPSGVELWLDKEAADFRRPLWEDPSAEQLQAAQDLLQRYLLASCTELEALCLSPAGSAQQGAPATPSSSATAAADAFGGHAHKTKLTSVLSRIWGILSGVGSYLHEFDIAGSAASGAGAGAGPPLCVVGARGVAVGPAGAREAVAATLARAARALSGLHPDVVTSIVASSSLLLVAGGIDHSMAASSRETVRRVSALVSEPAALAPGAGAGRGRRLPRFLAYVRLQQATAQRAAMAAFRSWCTAARPQLLRVSELPASALALTHELGLLALHRYRRVRHEASPVLEVVCKRFAGVSRLQLGCVLAAIADVPAPEWGVPDPSASSSSSDATVAAWEAHVAQQEDALMARLAHAAALGTSAGADAGAAAAAADANVAVAAGTAPAGADTDRDARCRGACLLLSMSLPLWRIAFRDTRLFSGMLHATVASRAYNTTPVQSDIGNLVILMIGRFMLPPSLDPDGPASLELSSLLLQLGRPGALRGATWRYTMMANVLALLVMPPPTSKAVLPHLRHLLELVGGCEVLGLRQLALGGITFNVAGLVEYAGSSDTAPMVQELRQWLGAEGNAKALMQHLVADHTQLDARDDAKGKRGNVMAMLQRELLNRTFEDMLGSAVRVAVERLDVWPEEDTPEALQEGLFEVGHARVVQHLSRLAPQEMSAGMRPLLVEMIAGERLQAATTSEKAEQAACAEVAAGLLAAALDAGAGAGQADATTEPGSSGSSGGGGWVLGLLGQAMAGTTLELSESWAVAARFAIGRLLDARLAPRGPSALIARSRASPLALSSTDAERALVGLLDLLAHLPGSLLSSLTANSGAGPAAPSSALAAAAAPLAVAVLPPRVKLMRYLLQAVRELRCEAHRPQQELPQAVLSFWSRVLDECRALLLSDVLSLREQAGALLAEALTFFPLPTAASSTGAAMDVEGDTGLDGQASELRADLTRRFAAAADLVQALRPATASTPAPGAPSSAPSPDAMDVVAAAGDEGGNGSAADGVVPGEALAVLGVGLQVVARGLKAVEPSRLRGSLLPLLPHLFKLQELAGPVLQKLAAESQLALVLLKYLQLGPSHVPAVVAAIQDAVASPVWSSRAAGLLFTQYFWFKQSFLLDGEQLQVLKAAVVSRLADSKAEVRAISTATLAGMIKGLPPREVDALRAQVLAQARSLLGPAPGAGSRAKAARHATDAAGPGTAAAAAMAAPNGNDLLHKHAAVLGLKAFLMSSPYDSPAWMPEVLLALVPGAGSKQPAAVRADASQALSEFKRTHEQDSMDALRAAMPPDDWDALQAVTSHASYFA